jgi:hypothetical protein
MTINSEQFQEICSGVWRDRDKVLRGRGFLSGEAALMRAVYWRLAKVGIMDILAAENYGSPRTASSYELGVTCLLEVHAHPQFNGAEVLQYLMQLYKNELSESC